MREVNGYSMLHQLEGVLSEFPALREWLAQGIQRWREDGERLDVALGLSGADVVRSRNVHLRAAAAILGADDEAAWCVAERLAQAIRRYETLILPRLHRGAALPRDAVTREIHLAFAAGGGMVRSRRRLYDLLRD